MGFLDWLGLTSQKEESVARTAPTARPHSRRRSPDQHRLASFDTWTDPAASTGSTTWEKRLDSYALKCAEQLRNSGVKTWRCAAPRDGKGTYRDAFWLISVDVDQAERGYHRTALAGRADVREGDFTGRIAGDALLLSTTGRLCTAKAEMFFPKNGHCSDTEMDSIFHHIGRDLFLLGSSGWAWSNRGRWRQTSPLKAYGLVMVERIEFRSKYPPYSFEGKDPGKGSSAALNSFVKSGGKVQWPRNFAGFDY